MMRPNQSIKARPVCQSRARVRLFILEGYFFLSRPDKLCVPSFLLCSNFYNHEHATISRRNGVSQSKVFLWNNMFHGLKILEDFDHAQCQFIPFISVINLKMEISF